MNLENNVTPKVWIFEIYEQEESRVKRTKIESLSTQESGGVLSCVLDGRFLSRFMDVDSRELKLHK